MKAVEIDSSDAQYIRFRTSQLLQDTNQHLLAKEILDEISESSDEFGPVYVGLAQCHLEEARYYANEWLPQMSYTHIEKTLFFCEKAMKIDQMNSAIVWKVAADALTVCKRFELNDFELEISSFFTKSGKTTKFNKNESLRLAITCYTRVISLDPKSALAWSDLSLAYFRCDKFTEAVSCGKKALELDLNNNLVEQRSLLWNNLGVVAIPFDLSLAQHSFIEAIECNKGRFMII